MESCLTWPTYPTLPCTPSLISCYTDTVASFSFLFTLLFFPLLRIHFSGSFDASTISQPSCFRSNIIISEGSESYQSPQRNFESFRHYCLVLLSVRVLQKVHENSIGRSIHFGGKKKSLNLCIVFFPPKVIFLDLLEDSSHRKQSIFLHQNKNLFDFKFVSILNSKREREAETERQTSTCVLPIWPQHPGLGQG